MVDQQRDRLVGAPPQQHAAVVTGIGVEAMQHGRAPRPGAEAAAEQRGEAHDGDTVAASGTVERVVVDRDRFLERAAG